MGKRNFKEEHIRQIPAMQMLVNFGDMCLINQNLHNKVNDFIVQKELYRNE